MKMLTTIKRLREIIETEDETQDNKRTRRRLIFAFCTLFLVGTIITSCLNIFYGSTGMLLSTVIFAVAFLICDIMNYFYVPIKYIGFIICSLVGIIFSFYVIIGGNQGFAINWILLVPYMLGMVFGIKTGLLLGFYFLVFLFVSFYTPLHTFFPYSYTQAVLHRFPLLYAGNFILSSSIQLRLKSLSIRQLRHAEELQQSVLEERNRVENISLETISTIMKALEAKDNYTNHHSINVARYAKAIAEKLQLPEKEIDNIYTLGLLHDIGKIGIPEAILNKPDKLTEEEFEHIKSHVKVGCEILKVFKSIPELYIGALYHHERYDGKGYANGLSGENLPIAARIIAVADSVDAMYSNRVYRSSKSREYVIEQLKKNIGTQFDPELSNIMIDLINEGILVEAGKYYTSVS